MTQQTLRVYERASDGAFVALIYDDIALTCDSAHVVCPGAPLVVTLAIAGQSFAQTFPANTDRIFKLPIAVGVVLGTGRNGAGISFVGFDSISFGSLQ